MKTQSPVYRLNSGKYLSILAAATWLQVAAAQTTVSINQAFLLIAPTIEDCTVDSLNRIFIRTISDTTLIGQNLVLGTACFVMNPIYPHNSMDARIDCEIAVTSILRSAKTYTVFSPYSGVDIVAGNNRRIYCISGVPISDRGYSSLDAYGIGLDGFIQAVWESYYRQLLATLVRYPHDA